MEPESLGGVDKPGIAVLKELLAQAETASSPSTAMLLERWRDLPEYGRLAELAMAEPLVADRRGGGQGAANGGCKSCSRNTARVAEWTNYCEKQRKWA